MDHPESMTEQFADEAELTQWEQAADEDGFLLVPDWLSTEDELEESGELPSMAGYQLHERIGVGGTSSVYRATRIANDEVVAIKILTRDLHDKLHLRFKRETEALSTLNHPGIARFIEAGVNDEGDLFLVLEFVAGQRIDRYCRRNEIPLQQRVKWLIEICDAIAHAHQQNILHRDLKPENILIDSQGRAIVTDFGFSKTLRDLGEETEKTRTGTVLGTLNYLAPEQIHGPETLISERTDIFGLGGILHVLLVHSPPFRFRNVLDAFAGYYDHYPLRLPADAGVPVDLEAICIKCLSPDPNSRYASATELKTDLLHFLADEPVLAKRQILKNHWQVFIRQYPWLVRLSCLTLVAIIVAAIWFLLLWQQSLAHLQKAQQVTDQRDETIAMISSLVRSWENDPSTLNRQIDMLEIISQAYSDHPHDDMKTESRFQWAENDFKLGLLYHHKAEHRKAVASYKNALRGFTTILIEEPNHEEAMFGRFHSLNSLQRYTEANQALDELLEIYPNNYDYQEAKVSTELMLVQAALRYGDFETGRLHILAAELAESKITTDKTDSRSIRRIGKQRIVKAQVAIAEGNFTQAKQAISETLASYQEMDLTSFPTDGEVREFFEYSRYAMSLAAYTDDYQWIKQISEEARDQYLDARKKYVQFEHFRYWYNRLFMEMAIWASIHDDQAAVLYATKRLHRGFLDWFDKETHNEEVYLLLYEIMHTPAGVNLTFNDEILDDLAELVDSRPPHTYWLLTRLARLGEMEYSKERDELSEQFIKHYPTPELRNWVTEFLTSANPQDYARPLPEELRTAMRKHFAKHFFYSHTIPQYYWSWQQDSVDEANIPSSPQLE